MSGIIIEFILQNEAFVFCEIVTVDAKVVDKLLAGMLVAGRSWPLSFAVRPPEA